MENVAKGIDSAIRQWFGEGPPPVLMTEVWDGYQDKEELALLVELGKNYEYFPPYFKKVDHPKIHMYDDDARKSEDTLSGRDFVGKWVIITKVGKDDSKFDFLDIEGDKQQCCHMDIGGFSVYMFK
jgi:hypothetical protein